MKSNSGDSDSSMNVGGCSVKLRFLILVVNTGDLINERSTPFLSPSHALMAPIAIFTTYIFLTVMVVGAIRQQYASLFLQMYALVACCAVEGSLSILVFKELEWYGMTNRHAALVLDGVLPMIIILLLLADLVIIALSSRDSLAPVLSLEQSHTEVNIH